jgi:hypothetical protein
MTKRATGTYERTAGGGDEVAAFIPRALPPSDPPLAFAAAAAGRLQATEQALVRLELAGEMVPSLDWFVYAFVRKEAVLSSQIEGTQATLVDLLTFEAQEGGGGAAASADVEEVCNYLDALAFARGQLADPTGLPLSMRLLNETHKRLLRGVRGEEGSLVRCDAARTGSAERGPATRSTCLHRRMLSETSSRRSRRTSTLRTRCRRSCAPDCFTRSSRRSIPTSTATVESADCW